MSPESEPPGWIRVDHTAARYFGGENQRWEQADGPREAPESPYGETREAQDEARQAQDGPGETQYEVKRDPK